MGLLSRTRAASKASRDALGGWRNVGCACSHRTCADEKSLPWSAHEPAAWQRRDGAISTPFSNTDDAVRRSWKRNDPTCTRWFHRAPAGRVASKRHMRSIFIVSNVSTNHAQQVLWPEHDHVIERNSRRSVPTNRSAKPFCHGERGAVRICQMPRWSTRASNALPKTLSRSRIKRVTGGASGPTASTSCWAAHAAWGMCRHVHVEHASPLDGQHEEDVGGCRRARRGPPPLRRAPDRARDDRGRSFTSARSGA